MDHVMKPGTKGHQAKHGTFPEKHNGDLAHATTQKLFLGRDFKIIKLDSSFIAKSAPAAKKNPAKYEKGELLFQKVMKILRDNFVKDEIESTSQYRQYFYDMLSEKKGCAPYFFNVAVDNNGEAIAVFIGSAAPDARLIQFNIIAVDLPLQLSNVASESINDMLANPQKYLDMCMVRPNSPRPLITDFDFVMAEIERPDFSLTPEKSGLTEKQIQLRNIIRPAFHDNVSGVRAIRLANGEALSYDLPIMASDSERKKAEANGEPFEVENLLFCLRPMPPREEKKGITSHEVAKLLIWFYKDYLEKECEDVKPNEVNELLSHALAQLVPGKDSKVQREFEALLSMNTNMTGQILTFIPNFELSFVTISETAVS